MMMDNISTLKTYGETDNVEKSFPYNNIYYFSLESQSNIYCCAKLISADEEKLIVGTLRGNVTCIEYENDRKNGRCIGANAVYFTYIPGMTHSI